MPGDDFDFASAVDDIGSGLGFGEQETNDREVEFQVDPPETTLAPTPAPAPADPAATPPAPPPSDPDPLATPPQTWKKEVAAQWAALPPEVRAEVQRREADIFKGIEGYREAANIGRSYQQALSPFLPVLQQHGIDPVQQVAGLMQAHQTLALGTPDQKQALFQKLAADYGVDLDQLSGEPAYVDPQVSNLRQQLSQIQTHLTAQEQQRAAQVRETTNKQIEAFASRPENTHFDTVAHEMAKLISSGVCTTLEEAYDKAVWANPVTRSAELAKQQAAAVQKAADEAAAAAAKARKATSANLRIAQRPGATSGKLGSMDDTLEAALADIKSRAS